MVRVTGGEAPGGSSLAPKIGPLGLVNIPNFFFIKKTNQLLYFSLQKRLVMISLNPQANGKACVSQSN